MLSRLHKKTFVVTMFALMLFTMILSGCNNTSSLPTTEDENLETESLLDPTLKVPEDEDTFYSPADVLARWSSDVFLDSDGTEVICYIRFLADRTMNFYYEEAVDMGDGGSFIGSYTGDWFYNDPESEKYYYETPDYAVELKWWPYFPLAEVGCDADGNPLSTEMGYFYLRPLGNEGIIIEHIRESPLVQGTEEMKINFYWDSADFD